jgi:hypothetical protein
MPVVALAVYGVWLTVTVGLSIWHQRRHTGDTGVRLGVAQLAALFVGLQIQVRGVEEPCLRRIHGIAYAQYATGVGRFVPGIGRSSLSNRVTRRIASQ